MFGKVDSAPVLVDSPKIPSKKQEEYTFSMQRDPVRTGLQWHCWCAFCVCGIDDDADYVYTGRRYYEIRRGIEGAKRNRERGGGSRELRGERKRKRWSGSAARAKKKQ